MPGIVGRYVIELGHITDREIAVVMDVKPQSVEHGQKTGRSQRRRTHQGSPL